MRIVIGAPRKSGGAHLRCLLSMAYALKAPPVPAPGIVEAGSIATWLSGLSAESVTTCDLPFSLLCEPASAAGVQLIGIVRHPFDLFVSNFDVAQQRTARGCDDEGDRARDTLAGEELGGDVARGYAATDFAVEVAALRDWQSNCTAVRYEELLTDPAVVLKSVSLGLGPLTDEQIRHAVDLCPVENVVASRPGRGRRMPPLPPGAWRERLPAPLVAMLRANYAADVVSLGYDAS